jgi:nucleoside-diphosphate-sugar epimerase
VQQTAQETDIFTVILRPRAIIGVGDTVIIPRVLKAYHARKLKMVGKGKTIADFTSVANLCHAAVLATNTQNPQCNGEIFNITDGEPQNLWDFIAFFLTQMHLNPTLKKVPYPLVYALAWCNQNFNAIFTPNTEPALTCYGVGILRYSLTMNIQKAVKLLDYQPITTSRQSIVKFVATQKNY